VRLIVWWPSGPSPGSRTATAITSLPTSTTEHRSYNTRTASLIRREQPWIERQTGWSIRKFLRTARRYRTVQIQADDHTITAADPLPSDLRIALTKINNAGHGAH
jgi:hypothetical protein